MEGMNVDDGPFREIVHFWNDIAEHNALQVELDLLNANLYREVSVGRFEPMELSRLIARAQEFRDSMDMDIIGRGRMSFFLAYTISYKIGCENGCKGNVLTGMITSSTIKHKRWHLTFIAILFLERKEGF